MKITQKYDIGETLEKVSVGANDKPVTNVVIKLICVDTKGIAYNAPEVVE